MKSVPLRVCMFSDDFLPAATGVGSHLQSISALLAKRGHSVKPPEFGDLVERCSPGPYVELFARAPRLGWDHWGHGYEVAS